MSLPPICFSNCFIFGNTYSHIDKRSRIKLFLLIKYLLVSNKHIFCLHVRFYIKSKLRFSFYSVKTVFNVQAVKKFLIKNVKRWLSHYHSPWRKRPTQVYSNFYFNYYYYYYYYYYYCFLKKFSKLTLLYSQIRE